MGDGVNARLVYLSLPGGTEADFRGEGKVKVITVSANGKRDIMINCGSSGDSSSERRQAEENEKK